MLDAGHPKVLLGKDDTTLELIKATLGVLPDHDVKVFLGVEGKWDIEFLKRISKLLHTTDATVPDLNVAEASGELVFIPWAVAAWNCGQFALRVLIVRRFT